MNDSFNSVSLYVLCLGDRADFDSWGVIAKDEKWSYSNISKVFKRMEDCSSIEESAVDSKLRGVDGPLSVSMRSPVNNIAQRFVDTAVKTGFQEGDYNNGDSDGKAALFQMTIKKGSFIAIMYLYGYGSICLYYII